MKCTLTIEDAGDPDLIRVNLEFDPPLTDDTQTTPAAAAALFALEAIADGSPFEHPDDDDAPTAPEASTDAASPTPDAPGPTTYTHPPAAGYDL